MADSSCRGYSPLYDRICRTVADSDEVLDLVSEAPPHGHNPVLLLAAVLDRAPLDVRDPHQSRWR